MKYLIIALLFISCGTYHAYKRVAADPYVDSRETVLLSQKCLATYPDLKGTSVIITGVDSSDYEATVKAYNDLLEDMARTYAAEVGEQAFLDSEAVPAKYSKVDSIRIIQRFVKTYRPAPIIKTVTTEVPVSSGVRSSQLERELAGCRIELSVAAAARDSAVERSRRKSRSNLWFIIGGLLFGGCTYFLGRLKILA